MPRYRRRLEIIRDILNAVGDGAKKTRIMYIANLSYKLLGKYLNKTVEAGLISSNNDFYEVTEKGQVFLERFDDFSSRYSKLERRLEEISFEREVLERMCELVVSGGNDPRRRGRR
jgi:predicted transcriptional regulator